MHKQLFNTGVRPSSGAGLWGEHQEWVGGTKHIAFYLDTLPPKGSTLKYLAQEPDERMISISIVGGGMLSEWAIYQPPIARHEE